ncbi:NUDIX domain protein [compost metagenome]
MIDPAAGKILLIHHKKLNKWLQPGGHCDGEEDTLAVAIKEVFEETGVQIRPAGQQPVDLDIHTIPLRKDVPEHEHFDVRYLFEYDSTQPLTANHETLALEWISFGDIRKYTNEESVLRILDKIS